jgi:rhomboid protease GluP
MKVSDRDPGQAVASRPGGGRLPRRWPVATVSVLAVTVVLTVLQFPFPQVRLDLWRTAGALAAGQWWRLVTALLVQYDPVWQIVVVLACLAGVGVLAERIFGHGRWLVLYLVCGVVGQWFGFRWEPPDAGASVAGAGLLGAVCAWLLSPAGPRQPQVRIWGILWPLAGVALTVTGDQHGPPLLVGFALGALWLWLDRRRGASPAGGSAVDGSPAGRRPRFPPATEAGGAGGRLRSAGTDTEGSRACRHPNPSGDRRWPTARGWRGPRPASPGSGSRSRSSASSPRTWSPAANTSISRWPPWAAGSGA